MQFDPICRSIAATTTRRCVAATTTRRCIAATTTHCARTNERLSIGTRGHCASSSCDHARSCTSPAQTTAVTAAAAAASTAAASTAASNSAVAAAAAASQLHRGCSGRRRR